MTLEKISGGAVKLTGRIDANNAKQFENELFAAAGGGNRNAVKSADGIMERLLRKVVIPNEQALRRMLRS